MIKIINTMNISQFIYGNIITTYKLNHFLGPLHHTIPSKYKIYFARKNKLKYGPVAQLGRASELNFFKKFNQKEKSRISLMMNLLS